MGLLTWMVLVVLLSSVTRLSAVDVNWLNYVVKEIQTKYSTGGQFSLAANIPLTPNKDRLKQILDQNSPDEVFRVLNEGRMFKGNNIIIATPNKENRVHAEPQVLTYLNLLKPKQEDFLLIYSQLSPCGKCTERNNFNINNLMSNNWSESVFVFTTVFSDMKDVSTVSKDDLKLYVSKLGEAMGGLSKVFRCSGPKEVLQCHSCSEGGGVSEVCVNPNAEPGQGGHNTWSLSSNQGNSRRRTRSLSPRLGTKRRGARSGSPSRGIRRRGGRSGRPSRRGGRSGRPSRMGGRSGRPSRRGGRSGSPNRCTNKSGGRSRCPNRCTNRRGGMSRCPKRCTNRTGSRSNQCTNRRGVRSGSPSWCTSRTGGQVQPEHKLLISQKVCGSEPGDQKEGGQVCESEPGNQKEGGQVQPGQQKEGGQVQPGQQEDEVWVSQPGDQQEEEGQVSESQPGDQQEEEGQVSESQPGDQQEEEGQVSESQPGDQQEEEGQVSESQPGY